MTEAEVKALLASELASRDKAIEKLTAENASLSSRLSESQTQLAALPETTRTAVEAHATKTATEQKVTELVERGKKAGLVNDDTKASFESLARTDVAAMAKMVERAEAAKRAPKGRLYVADTPEQARANEPSDLSTHEGRSAAITAALRLGRETGRKVAQTIREVTA